MNREDYNFWWLVAGVGVAILLFFVSLWLFPQSDWRAWLVLAGLVIPAGLGFVKNVRELILKKPRTEPRQEPSGSSAGNVSIGGSVTGSTIIVGDHNHIDAGRKRPGES